MEYHQSRPGLELLQQRIDDFITAHEEQEEQVVSTFETPKVGSFKLKILNALSVYNQLIYHHISHANRIFCLYKACDLLSSTKFEVFLFFSFASPLTLMETHEQARKEREALIAEDGWTVVVHHKGRKKTTDSETGVTVGSVAPAAVMDKLSKKKTKDVGIDFYRFQKREAQRNGMLEPLIKFYFHRFGDLWHIN